MLKRFCIAFIFVAAGGMIAARAIDDGDKAAGLQAAHYRLSARMRELEAQYDAKASELRAAFVAECTEILGGDE